MRVFVFDWDGQLPQTHLMGDQGRVLVPLRSLGLDAVVTLVSRRDERDGPETVPPLGWPHVAEMACIA